MICLYELLGISKENFCDYKVHFAIGSVDKKEPYNKFLTDNFKVWQEHQSNRNFGRKYIITLIYFEKDVWMFGGIYEVLSCAKISAENDSGWQYQTRLTDVATEYIGRAFFRFKKEFRASYPTLELEPKNGYPVAKMPLAYILEKCVAISDFVGFDKLNIDFETLQYIILENVVSWKSALSNVKGIYLIVDKLTGKQYVGSAYGDECVWQRWSEYVKNGHGENKLLKELLKQNGQEYRYNFKYSILEVCNMNLGNEYILARETYWKDVLLTRVFGMNEN